MRRGGRIMMIFGLVLGIITTIATLFVLRTARPETPEELVAAVETAPVIVAFQSIEPYQPIPAEAIGMREWPVDAIPTDVITDVAAVADKIPVSRIYPGQLLLEAMLIDKESEEQRLGLGSDPAYIIPEGEVAVALPIDEIIGVGGTIRDGDRVDVMATFELVKASNVSSSDIEMVTQLVAQNALVLKVGNWSLPPAEGAESTASEISVITLVVSPEEALRLKKAKDDSVGFDLALRAVTDDAERELDPVGDTIVTDELRFRTDPVQPLQ